MQLLPCCVTTPDKKQEAFIPKTASIFFSYCISHDCTVYLKMCLHYLCSGKNLCLIELSKIMKLTSLKGRKVVVVILNYVIITQPVMIVKCNANFCTKLYNGSSLSE